MFLSQRPEETRCGGAGYCLKGTFCSDQPSWFAHDCPSFSAGRLTPGKALGPTQTRMAGCPISRLRSLAEKEKVKPQEKEDEAGSKNQLLGSFAHLPQRICCGRDQQQKAATTPRNPLHDKVPILNICDCWGSQPLSTSVPARTLCSLPLLL